MKMKGKKPKIVYIDNYDSFANTIAAYFKNCNTNVVIFKSDCEIKIIQNEKPDMILLGPGPNGPKQAGNYLEIIDKFKNKIPIFGICLGFQAIMQYFGEKVKPLKQTIHGAATEIKHDKKGIFKNIKQNEKFARYHSLGVLNTPECFIQTAACSTNIIMAAKHKTLPIEGIQFHPESILSMQNNAGEKLIQNIVNKYLNN